MISNLKNIIKSIIPQSTFLQKFYRGIYYIGIWGMNYGVEGSIKKTGELKAIHRIKSYWNNQPILFDVGANVGDYTRFLSKLIDGHGVIHAFEPIQSTFQQLEQNISGANVHLHKLGLSNVHGEETIYYDRSRPSQASTIKLDVSHLQLKNEASESIQITTLDSFCALHNIECIDLLKIDVEGNELNVLRGAKNLLVQQRIRTIQFEFGTTQIDAHVFFKDFWRLLSPDFKIYRVLKNDLWEIKSYTESLEVLHFSNFIAVNKKHNVSI
jgi:FkbM family methyltransferase